jgi:hypothetical protein
MEASFQPNATSTAGLQVSATDAQGEARFTVTADANGTIDYFVCASYPSELEAAGWVTLVYRVNDIPCRSAVTGVVVTPSQTEIMPFASRQFSATVEGTANQAVTWSVSGGGSISSTGLFTSNGTAGTFFVTATSTEDPNSVGIAQVTVTLPCIGTACTFTGTWTRCEARPTGQVCGDISSSLSSPQARLFPEPGQPTRIAVTFFCTQNGAISTMSGPIQPLGAFTISQLVGANPCFLGTGTGTLTGNTLQFTLINAFDSRLTVLFSGTR